MTLKRRVDHAVGLRWGRLLASLESAKKSMEIANGQRDLLSKKEREKLIDIHEALVDLEFGAWAEENATGKALEKKR
jgi:hypothetical protein